MNIYAPVKQNLSLFEKHKATIERAIEAIHKREYYAAYPEMPSPAVYGESAEADQKKLFEAQLNSKFERLKQSHDSFLNSDEQSPFTVEKLGISYPAFADSTKYISAAQAAANDWKKTDAQTRAGILAESLDRVKASFFEIAFATMHTTGQSYMMSFQASGPHAADRAMEALALGYQELTRFPLKLIWEKPAGKVNLKLEKFITTVPKGLSLAIGCATFPTWNSVPGIYASLITGNPVIVKPHPKAIYPIAVVIAHLQDVLKENGFSPDLVMLACDTEAKPITKELAENPQIKIIDFTGSSAFGKYVESLAGKISFTEKAGVNSMIIDSVADLSAMAQNVAFSLCLYSGQMCTAPQNFFIPKAGIKVAGQQVSFEEVRDAIVAAVKGIVAHPKMGPAVLSAIQSEATQKRVEEAKKLPGKVLLESQPVPNAEFPKIRSASPIIIEISSDRKDIFQSELFGPIAFIIPTADTNESIELAASIAREHGAISCGAYTADSACMDKIAEQMAEACTPVSFNLTGNIYVNQNAGFSDFHVTGGNPSGNASLTDPEFVLKRFTRVQARVNG
ncbi:MAG: phenylacetic acid degradation protein PaaN [Candidatus Obscuribacterales bacterium]|nr:phenylacetic acid degradation protein PaaN [Candidatus Obscuribacterales bacterium]